MSLYYYKAEQDQLLAKRKQLSKQKEKQLSDLLLQQSLSVISPHYGKHTPEMPLTEIFFL